MDIKETQGIPAPVSSASSRATLVGDSEKANDTPAAPPNPQGPLDWDGPDDADNPMNWSGFKKSIHIIPVALLAFAVTAGSSLITPGIEQIQRQYGVSTEAAILSLSMFVVGLAVGPAVGAPLSELIGRSLVYKSNALVYMLFILGAGFSTQSFGGFLVCRLLAGIAGAPVLAVGAGTIADLFPPNKRAPPSATFIASPFLGPGIGPVIGGFVVYYKGWVWTQWTTNFVTLLPFIILLPTHETYKPVILRRRAKKRGLTDTDVVQAVPMDKIKMLLKVTMVRPLLMLYKEPIVLFFSLYNAFGFSVLFAFFAAYPYVFQKVYGFNEWQNGLTFLGIVVGVILAALTGILIDRVVYQKKHTRAMAQGIAGVPPEHRLYIGMIGSFGIPIGLFWFAWTARDGVHWISPVLAGIPFAFGNLAIFIAAALYTIDVYGPLNGASAMAANGLTRYLCGAAFPLFTLQMYERLGIAWATSLLGFLSIAMLPIPWILFKYGPKIRAHSTYTVQPKA